MSDTTESLLCDCKEADNWEKLSAVSPSELRTMKVTEEGSCFSINCKITVFQQIMSSLWSMIGNLVILILNDLKKKKGAEYVIHVCEQIAAWINGLIMDGCIN